MPNAHRACDDFHSTSETRRRSFLDTPLSRRQVIGRGLGAGLAVYAAKAMPLTRILEAAEAEAAAAPERARCSSRCSCRAAATCSTRSSR